MLDFRYRLVIFRKKIVCAWVSFFDVVSPSYDLDDVPQNICISAFPTCFLFLY